MKSEFVSHPGRPAAPVEQQPTAVLTCWVVMRLPRGEEVLIGLRPASLTWRRTTPVVEFLLAERVAITASGRRYALEGPPADAVEDAGCIKAMLDVHGIGDAIDTTASRWAAMLAASH